MSFAKKATWISFWAFLVVFSTSAIAQDVFTATTSGDWSTPGTWSVVRDGDNAGSNTYPGESAVNQSADGADVVIINGGVAVVLDLTPAASIGSLTVDAGTGTELDMAANSLDVTGTVTVNGDIDDTVGSSSITLDGDFTINSGATFNDTGNGISVSFTGTGTQTISGTYAAPSVEFNDFDINSSGTVDNNLSTDIIVSGQFLLQAGTFNAGSGTYTLGYAVLNGNTFDKTGGTFNAETSTFEIVATTNIRMSIDAATSFYAIVHAPPTGSRTLTLDETAAGDAAYTITNSLTLEPNSDGVGFLNGASIAYSGTTTLSYTTGNSFAIGNEWPATNSPTNVTFNSSGTFTLGASRTVGGTLTQTGGGTLDVTGGTLTVNGTLSKGTGTFSLNGGTLAYGGSATLQYTATQTAGDEWPATVPNVSVQSSSTVTLAAASGDRTISNNLTVASGSALTTNDNAVDVDNNLTVNGTLTTTNVAVTVAGTTDLGSNATITLGSGAFTSEGDVTMSFSSQISTSSTATFNSDFTISGGATVGQAAAGTLVMNGSSTATVSIDGTVTVFNFTVNKTGGSSVLVSTASGSQLRFNDNGTLYVQQGILQFSSTAQVLDTGGDVIDDNNITLQVDATGTLRTGGTDISGFSTFTMADNSTIEFTGTSAENVPTATYGNITANNTSANGVSLTGGITLQTNSTVTVAASRRLNLGNQTITHAGGASDALVVNSGASLYTEGTDISGFSSYTFSGTVRFNGEGTGSETMPSATYNNLVTNNSDGLVLSGGSTVNGTVTFTNGKITSSSGNVLTLGVSATATPTATSFVVGPVARSTNGAATTFAFPTGVSNSLRNVSITFDSAPATSNTITVTANGNAGSPTSNLAGVATVEDDGYWTITSTEVTPPSYTATFTTTNFSPAITGSSNVTMVRGTNPTYNDELGSSESSGTDQVTASFSGGFSDFAVANLADTFVWDGGGGDGLWNTATNWNNDAVPGEGDVVQLNHSTVTGAYTVVYNSGIAASSYQSITLSGSTSGNGITLTFSGSSLDLSATNLTVGDFDQVTFNGTNITGYSSANTDYQSGSTVRYNVGAANNIQADTYHNLTVSVSSGTGSNGAITVNGSFTNSGSAAFTANNTLNVTGSVSNSAVLNLDGTASSTFSGAFTTSANVNVNTSGSVTISGTTTLNGGTFTPNASTNINGDIVGGGGNFASGAGTVTMAGGSAQTLSGASQVTFNNLNLNNASGLSLSQSARVEGTFTFSNGLVSGSDTLIIGQSGGFSGASSARYVSGKVSKIFPSGAGQSFTYPTGKGGEYLPVTLSISASAAGYARMVEQINSSALDLDPDVDATTLSAVSTVRYWNIPRIGSGGTLSAFPTITLTWNSNDAISNLTALDVAQLNTTTGEWTSIGGDGSGDATSGTIQSSAFSTPGNFYTFGDDAAGGQDNSLPVSLALFEANAEFNKVILNWQTASETNNLGFNVYRQKAGDSEWQKVNTQLIPGKGTFSGETDYTFEDNSVRSGDVYRYQLESVNYSGGSEIEEELEITVPVPDQFVLFKNYPNPFNPSTNIKFQLPEYSSVTITIYDVNGRVVKKLIDQANYDAGEFVVNWNATNDFGEKVSSGMYFYRFTAGSFNKMGRMILIK